MRSNRNSQTVVPLTTTSVNVNIWKAQVNEMKAQILKALRECSDYVSGETLAQQLGISRVSIWKHMGGLKKHGYVVEASPRGYRLVASPDLLLPCEFPGLEEKIHYFEELGSTMDAARELAKKGVGEGTIVIAEVQTRGRGRLNREWLSPAGGIYFTIVLRPRISPVYAPRVNLMASVAVAATIERLYGLRVGLKWPNDVLIEGRKVCGILAEMDAEMDVVNFVNVGIGINANTSVSQFEEKATSVKNVLGKEVSRKDLLGVLLLDMERRLPMLMEADLLEEWKKFSITLSREVKIVSLDEEVVGQAMDIDATGALIVKGKDGSLRTVCVGDCTHLRA